MRLKEYIDSLFTDYETDEKLNDFKEELTGNFNDRINSLMKKGLTEDAAFKKASEELGDISIIANEISLQKRQEIFSEMYMGIKKYMNTIRVLLYIVCGLVIGFSFIIGGIVYAETNEINIACISSASISSFAIIGFVLLGLTQETSRRNPMSLKRAIFYGLAIGLILFGIIAFIGTSFDNESWNIKTTLGLCIPFLLPSVAIFAFLGLTEKNYKKEWVLKIEQESKNMVNKVLANTGWNNKYDESIGMFWGASVFLGGLVSIILGFMSNFNWVFSILIGACVFLIVGLILHGVITLVRKEK